MPRTQPTEPSDGQLWLSRPPFLLIAHVLDVDRRAARITYELLDSDGCPLIEPVVEPLEPSWWRNFQPLVRRFG
jgi:hypothetical protein